MRDHRRLVGSFGFASTLSLAACGPATARDAGVEPSVTFQFPRADTSGTDLLLLIDNSNSMRENQQNLLAQAGALIHELTDPPCVSDANPTPHACTGDAGEHRIHQIVSNLHVGVVSSDLGTPGSSVPGCANNDLGDDGLLNPIRNGAATARHEPWAFAPTSYGRPEDCTDPNQFPSFISFDSNTDDATFMHDFRCNAGIWCFGCGLESQLDAVYRALIIHNASDYPGNTSPNAGFVRENAVLGILLLTDEEDGSVRDCRFANNWPCDGTGAIDVYNPASTAWADMELNLRFYLAQPCSPQDPTWTLDRYIDSHNPTGGLLSVKPGHPERIVFGAITGVPLAIPTNAAGAVDWDGLLGVPGAGGPEDFCGRDSSGLASLTSAEGPISMAQANRDAVCTQRVVPACRREGSPVDPTACTADTQYFAWPARRIVEIARRFDESPVCNGSPCHNGFVSSICSSNYSEPLTRFARRIAEHHRECFAANLLIDRSSSGQATVRCRVMESEVAGVDGCDPARGRIDPIGTDGMRASAYVDLNGVHRRVCEVNQIPTDPITREPLGGTGWFYDQRANPETGCRRAITFTGDATPDSAALTTLVCPESAIVP